MSRRTRIVGAVAVISAVVAGCSSGSAPAPRSLSSAVPVVSVTARQLARFSLTGQPDWMGYDAHYLYVRQDSGTISAIDPQLNKVAWEVTVPSSALCQGLGVGFGSLWTCSASDTGDADDVVRVDSRTHKVVATLRVGKTARQGHLVTGFGRVWIIRASASGSVLIGIDPASNKPDPPIAIGSILASDLAIDDATIWAVSPTDGTVVGVDPTQRRVVHRIDASRVASPSELIVGGDDLWVSGDRGVAAIDRHTGKVVLNLPLAVSKTAGLAATPTDLWVHSEDPFLTHVDARTSRVVERVIAPELKSAGDVIFAFGAIWASANNESTLVRVRP
jgi:outer membrane protein assembly factor BamB